jgi:hypothetical protein
MNILSKCKSFVSNKPVATALTGVTMCFATAIPTLAEETSGSSSVVATLGTSLQSVQTDCMSAISTALPYALAVMGVGVVIGIGIKIFKRVTGKG